ncbi:MAG: hypothetical protein [Microviridae sp.]|nr:MAG: hypothetical protein [Microviridae sp.]
MSNFINSETGEVFLTKNVNFIGFAQSNKFDSQVKFTPRNDSEVNSNIYIVDDRDYLTLEQLIARCKRDDPSTYRKIRAGLMTETESKTIDEILSRDKEFFDTDDDDDYSRPGVDEVSTGAAEPPTTSADANPVDNDPATSSEVADTNLNSTTSN